MNTVGHGLQPPRNLFLDYCKGWLICLVVVGHAVQFVVYNGVGFWTDPLFKTIYLFHMPVFMGISGYLSHRGITTYTLRHVVGSKALAYLLPVVAWCATYRILFTLVTHPSTHGDLVAWTGFRDYESFWFLWSLYLSAGLTALVCISKKYFAPLYLASTVLVMLMPDAGILQFFKFTYPYFQLGYVAAKHLGGGPFAIGRPTALLLFLGATICYAAWTTRTYVYVSGTTFAEKDLFDILIRYAAGAICGLLFLSGANQLSKYTPRAVRNAVASLGKESLTIYLLQTLLFLTIANRTGFGVTTGNPPRFVWLLAMALSAVVCLVFCWTGKLLRRNPLLAMVYLGQRRQPRF